VPYALEYNRSVTGLRASRMLVFFAIPTTRENENPVAA
jgi:hypothetical protein